MLIYRRTSILESPAQTIVNTVNCVGVMGKGLAHAFKEREPAMYQAYKRICDLNALAPGKLWLWRGSDSWVLNFPTKIHWRNPSKLEWIEAGLAKFVDQYDRQGIEEISFPRLGCGNGGLDWDDVRPIMEQYLSPLPIPVYVHDFEKDIGLPEHLESIASELRKASNFGLSFGDFVYALRQVTSLSGCRMEELGSGKPFKIQMNADHDLMIETSEATWNFENEDLRGVWFDLQDGLVTKEKAGLAGRGGGKALVTMLSVLPNVRPIEICKFGAEKPEFAVELLPAFRGLSPTAPSSPQHELAWH
jgi:O-acetyl-ADP-ribose deacetylase (regulator of RNase III)